MPGEAREKCAVAGELTTSNDQNRAAADLYEMLYAMQHRGTEASGIATRNDDGELTVHRDAGMVVDVYDDESIAGLTGNLGVGQNRYATSGSKTDHLQPVYDRPIGFAFGHNGNLPTTDKLAANLSSHGIRHQKLNDSEMAGLDIAQRIRGGLDLPTAVEESYELMEGAFSCVAMHDGLLVAFRDPYGIRPLAMGETEDGVVVASETCGLDIIDATYLREVEPGEMVIISKDGIESRQMAEGQNKLDMFEFVYFARHDSQLYGKSVNEVRRRFGERLALAHPPDPKHQTKNIVVVPVPDTSIPAAEGYADALGLRHTQAVIKNRYIGRTFMLPNQQARHQGLKRKHNIIGEAVKNKDVYFVDDSIVRLNTMPRLVRLAYLCGARSVSVLIASPPVRFPDFYGIDTPAQDELAAANMHEEEMRAKMGAKYLGFLSLEGMVAATGLPSSQFNLSPFTGEYPIDIGSHNRSKLYKPVSMSYVE